MRTRRSFHWRTLTISGRKTSKPRRSKHRAVIFSCLDLVRRAYQDWVQSSASISSVEAPFNSNKPIGPDPFPRIQLRPLTYREDFETCTTDPSPRPQLSGIETLTTRVVLFRPEQIGAPLIGTQPSTCYCLNVTIFSRGIPRSISSLTA